MSWFSSAAEPIKPDPGTLPDIMDKKVIDPLKNLTSTIQEYKTNNIKKLIDSITAYDTKETNSSKRIGLDTSITKKVTDFHSNILKGLDDLHDIKVIKEHIRSHYQDDLDKIQKEIESKQNFKDSTLLKDKLSDVVKNIIDIRTNNSYFRYKYLQTTLFNLYFIQLVFNLIDGYTTEVTKFVVNQNENREKLMKNFMTEVINLLGSKDDFAFTDGETDALNGKMDQITREFERKKETLVNEMAKLKNGLNDQVAKAASSALDNKNSDVSSLYNTASSRSTDRRASNGSLYNTASSRLNDRRATYGGRSQKQSGGFIRDLSQFPKNFYDIKS